MSGLVAMWVGAFIGQALLVTLILWLAGKWMRPNLGIL
jgi:hypothetical protein